MSSTRHRSWVRTLILGSGFVAACGVLVGAIGGQPVAAGPLFTASGKMSDELICKGMNGRVGRSSELLVLARAIERDILIADSKAGGKVDVEDNLDLFEKLGLLEGHLMIGKALLDAKMQRDALPHFGHPVRELYDYIKPVFKSRNVPEFETELADLERRAKTQPNDPATTTAYNDVLRKIAVLRATIPSSLMDAHSFVVRAISLMMHNASSDLGESLERGRIVNTVEYHDAMGFAYYTSGFIRTKAAVLGADAERVAGEMRLVLSAFPALRPPERPTRSVGELESASHRVGAMAK
jgi:hypothetical protein